MNLYKVYKHRKVQTKVDFGNTSSWISCTENLNNNEPVSSEVTQSWWVVG